MQPPAQSVSFTEAEFAEALACLPAGKAVPHHLPPAVLWKSAATSLARKLLPPLNNEWLSDMTSPPPDEWNIADIFLLLKPGKLPTAAALRPISLLHPVAKALAVLLKDRLQPAADALLEHLPQYAYLHQRSAQDALDRFILDVLKSFGMQPSLDKTVVLVSLKGSSAQRILRRYITANPKKGKSLQVCTAEGQDSLVTSKCQCGRTFAICAMTTGNRHIAKQHVTLQPVMQKLSSWLEERTPLVQMALEMNAEQAADLMSAKEQAALLQGNDSQRSGRSPGMAAMGARAAQDMLQAAAPSAPSAPAETPEMDTSSRDKRGQEQEGWEQDWWSQDKTKAGKEKEKTFPEQEEVKALCISMSRLLLRHEDQQSIDRSEKGFILFCQARGMLSIIPDLIRTLETWAKMKEEQPTTLTLEAVTASEESKEQAQRMLILNPDGTVPYLQYNRQEQQMEVKKDREPMEYADVMKLLVELQDLALLPLSTQRFHAARKSAMTPSYKGEIVPMMLEVGLRTPEADRTWNILARLSHSGACRAIATTMRQERLGRSALAKLIQQQAESLSAP
ncbi:unnamed protein product [Symbiodinium necroappetens]|uniref:Reverse transcriptase domain-containing protein n=1 Tax=Symbiodinium necroappetens TaxID=1628268 RepID=A0A812V1L3_9DINO|nr:unnamed protein product [Symbiodinium necroappetens]